MKKLFIALGLACSAFFAQAETSVVLNPGFGTAILGVSCGGQRVNAVAEGFNANGTPSTIITVTTTCSGSGRASKNHYYKACARATYSVDGLSMLSLEKLGSGSWIAGQSPYFCPVSTDAGAVYQWLDDNGVPIDSRTLTTVFILNLSRAVLTLP